MKSKIRLDINDEIYEVEVENRRTLLQVIREDLGLIGTKKMCDLGDCGSCTVLLDGVAMNSCLLLAADAVGKKIETIEGMAQGGELHPIQEEFVEKGAIQCGFCTPGMVLTTKSLLEHNPSPSEAEIKEAIAGSFCRCTGYVRIVDAIKGAAARRKEW